MSAAEAGRILTLVFQVLLALAVTAGLVSLTRLLVERKVRASMDLREGSPQGPRTDRLKRNE